MGPNPAPATTSMIKNIFFDLGGVLLLQHEIKIGQYLSKIFGTELDHAESFYALHKRDLVIGNISSMDLIRKYIGEVHDSRSPVQLINLYRECYLKDVIGPNKDLYSWIDQLKNKYTLYMFTNTIDIHDEEAKKWGIFDQFTHVFKSYVDHIYKPEVASYDYCVNWIRSSPAECVFIDDAPENIAGAISAGLHGIVFKNNSQLKADLKTLITANSSI